MRKIAHILNTTNMSPTFQGCRPGVLTLHAAELKEKTRVAAGPRDPNSGWRAHLDWTKTTPTRPPGT